MTLKEFYDNCISRCPESEGYKLVHINWGSGEDSDVPDLMSESDITIDEKNQEVIL